MITDSTTGLHATQYRSIDGLQIRYAMNDKLDGEPILLLSPLPESILAFLPHLGDVLRTRPRHRR